MRPIRGILDHENCLAFTLVELSCQRHDLSFHAGKKFPPHLKQTDLCSHFACHVTRSVRLHASRYACAPWRRREKPWAVSSRSAHTVRFLPHQKYQTAQILDARARMTEISREFQRTPWAICWSNGHEWRFAHQIVLVCHQIVLVLPDLHRYNSVNCILRIIPVSPISLFQS